MLELKSVNSYYGEDHILFDVDMHVEQGEVVSIVGRNGAGKTTVLRSILNFAEVKDGTITYEGKEITNKETDKIAEMGIGYVPEDRQIFSDLTVEENLIISASGTGNKSQNINDAYEIFPNLKELKNNKGDYLSGGEQQMLAIARALVNDNDLLLIDEPTEGLAPQIADDVRDSIMEIKDDQAILLVEQSTEFIFEISDRIYGLSDGKIAFESNNVDEENKKLVDEVLTLG